MARIFGLVLLFSLSVLVASDGYIFQPIEKARLRVFESLYAKDMDNIAKQQKFLKENFTQSSEHDIYTFPNASIKDAYKGYADASSDELLHRDLPSTNKAYKVDATKENHISSLVTYVWSKDSKKLVVTSLKLDGEELCSKEVLDFEQKSKATILKVNFEQYCF